MKKLPVLYCVIHAYPMGQQWAVESQGKPQIPGHGEICLFALYLLVHTYTANEDICRGEKMEKPIHTSDDLLST